MSTWFCRTQHKTLWKGKAAFIFNKTDSSHSHSFSWISLTHILVFSYSQAPRCVYLQSGQDPCGLVKIPVWAWRTNDGWYQDLATSHGIIMRFLSIADNKLGFGLAFQPFYKSNNYSTVPCLWVLLTSVSTILRPGYGSLLLCPHFGRLYGYSLSSCWNNKEQVLMQWAVIMMPSLCSHCRLPADSYSVLWPFWNTLLLILLQNTKFLSVYFWAWPQQVWEEA